MALLNKLESEFEQVRVLVPGAILLNQLQDRSQQRHAVPHPGDRVALAVLCQQGLHVQSRRVVAVLDAVVELEGLGQVDPGVLAIEAEDRSKAQQSGGFVSLDVRQAMEDSLLECDHVAESQ